MKEELCPIVMDYILPTILRIVDSKQGEVDVDPMLPLKKKV